MHTRPPRAGAVAAAPLAIPPIHLLPCSPFSAMHDSARGHQHTSDRGLGCSQPATRPWWWSGRGWR